MKVIFWSAWLWSSLTFAGTWNDLWDAKGAGPPGGFSLRAYSEFMPAPRAGARPYEWRTETLTTIARSPEWRRHYDPKSPSAFQVSWFDELRYLRPGLEKLATDWLQSLPSSAGPVVAFFSVALSQTQDDLGRTPWTVLGSADGEPEEEFWRSLRDHQSFPLWMCTLLSRTRLSPGPCSSTSDLERLGLRLFSKSRSVLPDARRLRAKAGERPRLLLTFLPTESWPESWKTDFESGKLVVLPHPSTLSPWRSELASRLRRAQDDGGQIPLAEIFSRSPAIPGLRVPKSGALEVTESDRAGRRKAGRFSRLSHALWGETEEQPVSLFRLVFDPSPEVTELYGKPVARNTQVWGISGENFGRFLLDGPRADKKAIDRARRQLLAAPSSDRFAYREKFPPLEMAGHSVVWHRPLAAWTLPDLKAVHVEIGRLGRVELSRGKKAFELEPRLEERYGVEREMAEKLVDKGESPDATALNVLKVFEHSELLGEKLPLQTVSALLTLEEGQTASDWLAQLSANAPSTAKALESRVERGASAPKVKPLTFGMSLGEKFEHAYWDKIVDLTEGPYRDKNNVDCTAPELNERCRRNHLPLLADAYFSPYYRSLGLRAQYHAFHWVTDFDWQITPGAAWWGGLELNLPGRSLKEIARTGHKNVVVVIPGKIHDEAVLLADHYDTAYMDDVFEEKGLRHAAKGADDNHSGTATLMEAARILSALDLKRDVWLVHLTGEEFPADCLGARALSEALVNGTPVIPGRRNPKIVGLYVLDMIGHSTDRDHDPKARSVFQMATGRGARAAHLGRVAHQVTESWNASVSEWNRKEKRTASWERIQLPKTGKAVPRPRTAVYPDFRGEIRPGWHYRSALYNTDGIVFSDSGIPAVLFMENYDIGRAGYHDTKDTLENLDLDFAAGMARIAIETVAQVANE
jgi:hypothetical protein